MASNIHLIVGDDSFLCERLAKKAIDAVIPADMRDSASIEKIDGDCSNQESQAKSVNDCLDSILTPPFLEPFKVTWWHNVTFLPQQKKPSNAIKEALNNFAKKLADSPPQSNQALIITGSKLLSTSSFAKTMSQLGEVNLFATEERKSKRIEAAVANVPIFAKEFGLSFAPGAANTFISKVGADSRTIFSELEKLRTYLGPNAKTVKADDIEAVSSPGGGEPELWELTDAVAMRNPERIRKVISYYEEDSGSAILLANILERFFRQLTVYRDAINRKLISSYGLAKNISAEDAAALQRTGIATSGWMVRKNVEQAGAFTLNELRVARWKILSIREKAVSSGSIAAIALIENALMEIIRRKTRTAR